MAVAAADSARRLRLGRARVRDRHAGLSPARRERSLLLDDHARAVAARLPGRQQLGVGHRRLQRPEGDSRPARARQLYRRVLRRRAGADRRDASPPAGSTARRSACSGRRLSHNERRVVMFGFDSNRLKAVAFGVSGLLAGIGGALYAPQQGLVTPQLCGFALSADLVIWAAVGGRGRLLGPVLGAIVIGAATSALRDRFQFWEIGLADRLHPRRAAVPAGTGRRLRAARTLVARRRASRSRRSRRRHEPRHRARRGSRSTRSTSSSARCGSSIA